ncbi:unnamed protein product [Prunus brigantina]
MSVEREKSLKKKKSVGKRLWKEREKEKKKKGVGKRL